MNFKHTRFLIIRLSSIGDVLHATTVAHNLKLHEPDCHITWMVSPPASELLRHNPDIDELFVWNRNTFEKALFSLDLPVIRKSLHELRLFFARHSFDILLDIHCLLLTGIIARMSHVPRRIGIYERHEGNQYFMTEHAPRIDDPHKIRRYLTVLQPLGIHTLDPHLILQLPPTANTFAEQFFSQHAVDLKKTILMVNIRTTWPDKNWPPASFAAALSHLPEQIQVIFCGSAADQSYISKAMSQMQRPALSIAGQTSLPELAALFARSTLLLTGDTGPLYIAAAVNLPTLSLWGPTHPSIYGPLTGSHTFVLSPGDCTVCCKTHCRHKTNACMKAIAPAIVAQKLDELLHLENQ